MRPAFIRQWISDRMNSPSVPGVMPTQSSAMALYPVRIGFTPMTRAPRFFSLPRPILIGLLSWSSATPNSMNSLV